MKRERSERLKSYLWLFAPQWLSSRFKFGSALLPAPASAVPALESASMIFTPFILRHAGVVALSLLLLPMLVAHEAVKTTYTYKTVGDLPIRADVYRLPGAEVRPVVLWIHGGALIMGSRNVLIPAQAKKYLEAGYAIVAIDYRLAPVTKLSQILEDVADAYAWLRREGPGRFQIDPRRIAVVGHSAGGYLALTSGFRLSPRPAAVVAFYGYGEIASEWYSRPDPFYQRHPLVPAEAAFRAVGTQPISEDMASERGLFYLYTRQQGRWPQEVAGYDPDREPRAFDAFCALRNVTPDYPPTLLIHGDQDTDVPFEQSALMAREFERHGVPHEFVQLTGKGHGFDEAMTDPVVGESFDRILTFLERHLGAK